MQCSFLCRTLYAVSVFSFGLVKRNGVHPYGAQKLQYVRVVHHIESNIYFYYKKYNNP